MPTQTGCAIANKCLVTDLIICILIYKYSSTNNIYIYIYKMSSIDSMSVV